jgi:hypothetical protein
MMSVVQDWVKRHVTSEVLRVKTTQRQMFLSLLHPAFKDYEEVGNVEERCVSNFDGRRMRRDDATSVAMPSHPHFGGSATEFVIAIIRPARPTRLDVHPQRF